MMPMRASESEEAPLAIQLLIPSVIITTKWPDILKPLLQPACTYHNVLYGQPDASGCQRCQHASQILQITDLTQAACSPQRIPWVALQILSQCLKGYPAGRVKAPA